MICLFNSTASKSDLIQTNGDYILDMLCTSAIITEELNGEYSFDGVFRISDTFPKALYDMLTEESILKVNEEYGIEYFRIAKVIKTNKNITVFARHITISDILTLWCEDVRPENQNGAGAISWIYNNSIGNKILTVNSDITETNTSYFINKNVYECLFTADNSFLDRWGGEVYRRGFNLAINKRVGADRGVTIRSKKNLTGFEATTSVDTLITRIYPKGYDGITINEKYIDSKYINNYARIYSKEVKFDDIKVNGESIDDGFETLAAAQEELKTRVKQMYEVDKVDLLTATYRINFVELGKTEEYKNYSILEQTWLGDTVEVIEDTLGVNISVRVLKRKFDVLKNKRTETELSNKDIKTKPPTIQQIANEIEKIPTTDTFLQIAKDQATSVINAGINGYVVANKNEILIMDTPDKNTATKVWRMNVNGIGYSNTGYYGEYGTAITMEGQIVADFISVGILNANLIKAGVLSSFNNKTWISMEDGTFNFANLLSYDGTEMKIKDSAFRVVDANDTTIAYIGQDNWLRLQGLQVFGAGECFQNKGSGARSLKLTSTDGGSNYIDFNEKEGVNYTVRMIREKASTFLKLLASGLEVRSYTNNSPAGVKIRSNGETSYLDFVYNAIDDYNARLAIYNNDKNIHCIGDGFIVQGNLQVTGNKNCIQNTEHYGQVAFYATEDCESYFTDRSMELFTVEQTIDGTFERVILLDGTFKECVNVTDYEYTVEIIKQGWGDYRIKEQTSDYFIVEADRVDFTFKYIVTARRKGYENARLEEYYSSEVEEV